MELRIGASVKKKQSAGLLLYRQERDGLGILLVHPGGPFWKNKDNGAWSIPKGEFEGSEVPLEAARREFHEETGLMVEGEFRPLGSAKQKSGKIVHAWAVEADCDAAAVRSNSFAMEWPPKSGRMQDFPEIDRAQWFSIDAARTKIHPGQVPFITRLLELLGAV